jgi:hypothetical protein
MIERVATDRDRAAVLFHRFDDLFRRGRRNNSADGYRVELSDVVDQKRRSLTLKRLPHDRPEDCDRHHGQYDGAGLHQTFHAATGH